MADISLCNGDGCSKKEQCYRFTAKPSSYQTYFASPPLEKNGDCSFYWNNYDRMKPTLIGLTSELEAYSKVSYGKEAYPLSQKEAEFLLLNLKQNKKEDIINAWEKVHGKSYPQYLNPLLKELFGEK